MGCGRARWPKRAPTLRAIHNPIPRTTTITGVAAMIATTDAAKMSQRSIAGRDVVTRLESETMARVRGVLAARDGLVQVAVARGGRSVRRPCGR